MNYELQKSFNPRPARGATHPDNDEAQPRQFQSTPPHGERRNTVSIIDLLQFLVARINLESAGLQCRNAEQRLRALVPKQDRTTDDLPFQLNLSDGYVQGNGLPIRKYILPAASRFEANRFEVRPRHERVERASIDEEFAGPASPRIRRTADGYVNTNRAHCGSPSELVLPLRNLKCSENLFTMQGVVVPECDFLFGHTKCFNPRGSLFFIAS